MGEENLPRYDLMFTVFEVLPLLFEIDLKKKSWMIAFLIYRD